MEQYINNYEQLKKIVVYSFDVTEGGIGDCIKFFIYALIICIKYNYKLYYLINNIPLEQFIRLKYDKMYITKNQLKKIQIINYESQLLNLHENVYNIVKPMIFYNSISYEKIPQYINNIFYFSDEVKLNSKKLLSSDIINYNSIHLRLGDKFLETDKSFVMVKNDVRKYDEEKLFKCIEENQSKNIIFFCDNNSYKLKIKEKYNQIIITNCNIGHTSLTNTSIQQILDAVTEFYLLTNSEHIYCGSISGFSIIASKFNNIPITIL